MKERLGIWRMPNLTPGDIGGYWYLASPYSNYSGGIDAAFEDACAAVAALIAAGYPVFSPIAHCHPIALHGGLDPRDHAIWLPADTPMMAAAAGLIVLKMDGWRESFGVAFEIAEFAKRRKPIRGMEWPCHGSGIRDQGSEGAGRDA